MIIIFSKWKTLVSLEHTDQSNNMPSCIFPRNTGTIEVPSDSILNKISETMVNSCQYSEDKFEGKWLEKEEKESWEVWSLVKITISFSEVAT